MTSTGPGHCSRPLHLHFAYVYTSLQRAHSTQTHRNLQKLDCTFPQKQLDKCPYETTSHLKTENPLFTFVKCQKPLGKALHDGCATIIYLHRWPQHFAHILMQLWLLHIIKGNSHLTHFTPCRMRRLCDLLRVRFVSEPVLCTFFEKKCLPHLFGYKQHRIT